MNTREELTARIEELEERKSTLENNENTDEYDSMLDDTSGPVKIGSLEYSASHVLKNIDEIAYNCGFNDFNDAELSDIETELEELKEELATLDKEEQDEKEGEQHGRD